MSERKYHSSTSGSPAAGPQHGSSAINGPHEPLAVVGMAFKFPQEASSEDGLWKMLVKKQNAMTEYPKDRLNIDAFYHPESSRPDTISYRGGHFLPEFPSAFDAPFFSITAAEAEAMDPQHRLVLETTYHAMESAGITMDQLSGSRTSVHAGTFSGDYKLSLREPERLASHAGSGTALAMLSNRVSWFFNLKGPSVTIDTACSSSMTALDISCQGLRTDDADTGIIVGSNLIYSLDLPLMLSNMNFTSPDSLCYAFDHRGNGYGRGEGVAVLIVKRLSSALKAGDTIRAVIRATGSNQDGRTPGITQPSLSSQESLIRATYAKCDLDMRQTSYVEAHGTGTPVGDPIEAAAIGNAFKDPRRTEPLYIGSIKSNLGHLEGCSSLAGVIKTILMLERGIMVPNANFEKLNPNIDATKLNIKIVTDVMAWPTEGLRRASVSSFGFGGANSHVVLDDACNFLRMHGLRGQHCTLATPPLLTNLANSNQFTPLLLHNTLRLPNGMDKTTSVVSNRKQLVLFSAADRDGIDRIAESYATFAKKVSANVTSNREVEYLEDLAHTLNNRRDLFSWRASAIVSSVEDLGHLSQLLTKPTKRRSSPRLAYVFTGQGAQYVAMAKDLLSFPVVVASLRKSEEYFNKLGADWSLISELTESTDAAHISQPGLSQPLCTALQVAIIDLLRHCGVSPHIVVGHSSGEIAASYAIGAISQSDSCKIAYYRGVCADELVRAQQASGRSGSMMSVGLSSEEFAPYAKSVIEEFHYMGIVVACINSPRNITLSGDSRQIDWLQGILETAGVFARKLRIGIAYHSPHMREVAARYLRLLGRLEGGHNASVDAVMVSSVTGQLIGHQALQQSQYWVDNLVSPVKFSDALVGAFHANKASGTKVKISTRKPAFHDIVEIGPHPALRGPSLDSLRDTDVGYLSAMNRSVPGDEALLNLIGELVCKGYNADVSRINLQDKEQPSTRMTLPGIPSYPFDHSRHYWHEGRSSKEGYRLRKFPRLDLLGTPSPEWNALEPRWRCIVRSSESPWIPDHQVKGTVLYPAAGMVAMALEAVKQMVPSGRQVSGYVVRDTVFARSIAIPEDSEEKELEIVLRPSPQNADGSEKDSMTWNFKIYAYEVNADWQEKCEGTVSAEFHKAAPEAVDDGREASARRAADKQRLIHARGVCATNVDPKLFYTALKDEGYIYGTTFQAISSLRSDNGDLAVAEVDVFDWPTARGKKPFPQDHIVHPTTLDAMFQVSFITASKGSLTTIPSMLPSRLHRMWIRAEGANSSNLKSTSMCLRSERNQYRVVNDGLAVDPDTGETIISIEIESSMIEVQDSYSADQETGKTEAYQMQWEPDIDLMDNRSLARLCQSARPTDRSDSARSLDKIDSVMIPQLIAGIDSLSKAELAGLQPHLQQYVAWAMQVRDEHKHGRSGNRVAEDHVSSTQGVESSELVDAFTNVSASLPSLLSGEIDPLKFMTNGGAAERLHEVVNREILCLEPINRLLQLLSHKNPSLKILEVGAGEGGFTQNVIGALTSELGLALFSQYDCTDISPACVEACTKRFAEHAAIMNFRTLDIQDSADQGLSAGTYDVVFAANVLHSVNDPERALHNIHKLLKPTGKLVLVEAVKESVRSSSVFGLLPQWWSNGADGWQRPVAEWHKLLQRTGFSGVDVEVPDFEGEAYHEYSSIITTKTVDQVVPSVSGQTPIALILDDSSEQQLAVAGSVRTSLQKAGHTCEVISWGSLSKDQASSEKDWLIICELDRFLIAKMGERDLEMLKSLAQAARSILWVTGGGGHGDQDPRYHIIDGVGRTIDTEYRKLAFTTLALEVGNDRTAESIASTIVRVQNTHSAEFEYLERDGHLCINRVTPSVAQESIIQSRKQTPRNVQQRFGDGRPLALAVGSLGALDTLHFVDDNETHSAPLAPDHVEVLVDSAGVNFRDFMTALGRLEADFIGIEYAGTVHALGERRDPRYDFKVGDRVVGWCFGSYKTYTRNHAELVLPVPDNLELKDAVAGLLVFVTAWHSLVNVARVRPGESVLIHSASGGTGQAAIQVAKFLRAEVFVTAGSLEKKRFLQETYGIPAERIFASRDLTFADGILRETKGRGVDVILNSLSGESLTTSWNCIAPFGRFVEIGVRDIAKRGQLPMWPFRNACTFAHVRIDKMRDGQVDTLMEAAKTVIGHLSTGVFTVPQPLQVFGISQVQDAFRSFQGGQNYGKMVVRMRPDDMVDARLKPSVRYTFNPERTYVIVGGLGGLGRTIILWMYERGARNFLLLSRSGAASPTAQNFVHKLVSLGIGVLTPKCDVSDRASLERALAESNGKLPPVAGCIQAAMALKNDLFENLSFESWKIASAPKIQGTWNLHLLLPSGLDFFVCLSSISCILGTIGQANYAAGNAYMDELVRYRISRGEAATTINLGWLETEGVVADIPELKAVLNRVEALPPVSTLELLTLLDLACDPMEKTTHHQLVVGLTPPKESIKDYDALVAHVPWLQRPSFNTLMHAAKRASDQGDQGNDTGKKIAYTDLFRASTSLGDATDVVRQCVRNRLSKALKISEPEIDLSQPFHVMGIDSLFGIELRNYLAKQFDAEVAVFDLMSAASIEAACELTANRSKIRKF